MSDTMSSTLSMVLGSVHTCTQHAESESDAESDYVMVLKSNFKVSSLIVRTGHFDTIRELHLSPYIEIQNRKRKLGK